MTELDASVRGDSGEPTIPGNALLESALMLLPRSAVAVLDLDLRIVEAFGEAFSKRDYETEKLLGRTVDEVFLPETVEILGPHLRAARTGEHRSFEMPSTDGQRFYLIEVRPVFEGDTVKAIFGFASEITERKLAEARVAEERQLFETAFQNAPNGMALVGINGRFLRANPAMCDLVGYPTGELLELKVADIAHPDDMEEQVVLVKRALAGEFDSYSLEKRFTRKNGEPVWLVLAVSLVRDPEGEPLYVIAQTTNISANKRIEADLRSKAGKDPLTELANRRQIETAMEVQISRAAQTGESSSLLMVDLDDFKGVNDRYGHEAGDDVLRFFATELKNQVRANDLPARFGGDEFVVLMDGVDAAQAEKISAQLMEHFGKVIYQPDGLALRCSVSVGTAQIATGTETPAEVLSAADRSMYEVKRAKKSAG